VAPSAPADGAGPAAAPVNHRGGTDGDRERA
jgi:hypothetical protein